MSRLFRHAGLFFALVMLTVCSQWQFGAYSVEAGAHSDEPAHIVTGLMVHDWIAAGFPRPAMAFAENYYLHYPRVGLGHWPPMFYVVQAVWTLVFGASLTALLFLMAVLTALLCFRVGQQIDRLTPGWYGAAAAVSLLALAPVVVYSGEVMAEILLCWLCLEAVLAFAAWMESPGWKRAGWFGLWAAAACLTKVTAVWLAPMAGLAILISKRHNLWKEKSLWAVGLLVAAVTVPWYLMAPGALHQASPDNLGVIQLSSPFARLGFIRRATISLRLFPTLLGWMGPLLAAALWGLVQLWRRQQVQATVVLASIAAMILVRFAVAATAYEDRTVMPLLAPLVICVAGAVPWLKRFPVATCAAVFAFLAWGLMATPAKPAQRVDAASRICQRPEYRDVTILVAAGFQREGALVADVALAEKRLGHMVIRASKVMASSTWVGRRYRLLLKDTVEAMQLLNDLPVGLLVVESDPRRWLLPHQKLIAETIIANRSRFRLIHAGPLNVYEVAGFRDRPRKPVSMYMYGLGRSVGGATP